MNDHYYTAEPGSAHDVREHGVTALHLTLRFDTDAGVFSKDGLDDGSKLLLESLPPLADGARALDLGCGWGALGAFLAAKYPKADLLLSDVNERACALARGNLLKNRLTNARVAQSDAFERIEGEFDLIATNPPIRAGKRVVYAMLAGAVEHLAPGGRLFAVIRKQQGAESALAYLRSIAPDAERVARDKGFWILSAGKEGISDDSN